ncbi:MAG: class I SAM-dependent methyltransferase [bacterium]|nr:class I SAM-dependent methyltransferase [bacterium]
MRSRSLEAYDLPERVRTYDADMDIMHPLRWKMIEIALEVLPFQQARSLKALDLGVGTGMFSKRFLETYPNSSVVAIDGAAAMLELAKARLGGLGQRVEWFLSDFRSIPKAATRPETFDVVYSSYALHHLNAEEKLAVLKSIVQAINPAGWLLNADIVVAEAPDLERRIQEIRVEAVTGRASTQDKRFHNHAVTRQYLDDLELAEQDQPQTLDTDIQILRESGITNAEVFWKEHRETVMGGTKPTDT